MDTTNPTPETYHKPDFKVAPDFADLTAVTETSYQFQSTRPHRGATSRMQYGKSQGNDVMKKVYVYSKSLFHDLMDRYRVDVDEPNYRRKDGGCGSKGCVCGYPLGTHVEWGVVGHPDWTVEVEESPSGGIVILVPGERCWFERGRYKGLQEWWPDDVLDDRSQTYGSLYEFGIDSTKERELCDEFQVPECFRKSFLDGLLSGLQEALRGKRKREPALAKPAGDIDYNLLA